MTIPARRLDQEIDFRANSPALETLRHLVQVIETRLRAVESDQSDVQEGLNDLLNFGLAQINEVLQPAVQAVVDLADIGLVFTASSTTPVDVRVGPTLVEIPADERERFAPTSYMAMIHADGLTTMAGTFESYDRPNGLLSLDIAYATGVLLTGNSWTVIPASPPFVPNTGLFAPVVDAHLTGTPTVPTPAVDTNTQQIANCAFVIGQTALAAPILNAHLTGIPTVPTPAANTNTQQVANCAFVISQLAALVAAAPSTLDTLDEIAAALGDDANYAATIAAQIGTINTSIGTLNTSIGANATAIASRVRFDAAQTLTNAQKAQVHSNLAPIAEARTAVGSIAEVDREKLILATGTWTLTLGAIATLGNGFRFWIKNDGPGIITITPAATEQIDGAGSLLLCSKQECEIRNTGSAWRTVGLNKRVPIISVDVAPGSASVDFSLPPGYAQFRFDYSEIRSTVDNDYMIARIANDGVPTFKTDAGYWNHTVYGDGTGIGAYAPSALGYSTITDPIAIDAKSSGIGNMQMSPGDGVSSPYWLFQWASWKATSTQTAFGQTYYYTQATRATHVRFLMNSGNFNKGRILLHGVAL